MKKVYYFIKSIITNLSKRKKVSYASRIHPKAILGDYVKIGSNSYFRGSIGSYSYIGNHCIIKGEVGKFCSIGNFVKVIDGTHPLNIVSTSPCFYSNRKQNGYSFFVNEDIQEIIYADDEKKLECIIKNDVWIGENVLIKAGVTIENGAVIAMGSVVVSDVKAYSIVGGNPAKVIKYRFSDDIIKKLNNSQWWNYDSSKIKSIGDSFSNIDDFIEKLKENK